MEVDYGSVTSDLEMKIALCSHYFVSLVNIYLLLSLLAIFYLSKPAPVPLSKQFCQKLFYICNHISES